MPNEMSDPTSVIRNVAEVEWQELPGHHGGALSKLLVHPDTLGSRQLDYRISLYQPKGHVERHSHVVQEQIYHVLSGEGLMEVGTRRQVVRTHDVIFIPPGVMHSISNTGLTDLVFLVITSPVTDTTPPAG
jgi:mannose-6-phosphate isomerase-like protein (cupin superfamily)